MTEPYLGEIQLFGFDFAPRGWASCNGTLLPIQQNSELFFPCLAPNMAAMARARSSCLTSPTGQAATKVRA